MGLTVNVSGRLGKDPETRYTEGGMAITSFSVACSEYNSDTKQRETIWAKCVLFGKRGENFSQVARKGTVVSLLAGKQKKREYQGKEYTDYTFDNFDILSSPPKEEVPF